jgi:hypothetical protein
MGQLALAIGEQGRATEAEEIYRQELGMRERISGLEHPATLSTIHNLSCNMHNPGRTSDAIALMRRCYELRKEKLGLDHPQTEDSLYMLDSWRPEHPG